MPRLDSSIVTLFIALTLAGAVGATVTLEPWEALRQKIAAAKTDTKPVEVASAETSPRSAPVRVEPTWAASAPGRVEPNGGAYRIVSQASGPIVAVAVETNDVVRKGEVMVRIDDADLTTRLDALLIEADVRQRERDKEPTAALVVDKRQTQDATKAIEDRRKAEDDVEKAARAIFRAKLEIDAAIEKKRRGEGSEDVVDAWREALAFATKELSEKQADLREAKERSTQPLPSRLDGALASIRSEIRLAEAAIERTRVRAPADGTVLQLNAKVGELAGPASDQPLVVMGDLTSLQVRAEIEERDVPSIRVGQRVIVRSDAYPGQTFDGSVTTLARSLAPQRLPSRGPRRPTDVEVLEGVISMDGVTPLLPGMRVDVFFKPDATVQIAPTSRSN